MKKTLEKMVASDIMQTDVITADDKDNLQDAMALMTENHVTGLPVLDSRGRCIGIISATDILRFEQEHAEETSEVNDDLARHYDPDTGRWEDIRLSSFALEEFADVRVSEIMSSEILSVAADTPVTSVAEKMLDGEVHRILVLDADQTILGVISATDFVRLFAEL